MKLVVAADEKIDLTDFVIRYLEDQGHELILLGDLIGDKKWQWAEIGREAAEKIASKEVNQGILFCWSGTGICMAANKVKGVRAALCWDAETAKLARKWNDANALCLSLRYITPDLAKDILDAWFKEKFDEEDLKQVEKLN